MTKHTKHIKRFAQFGGFTLLHHFYFLRNLTYF